jgi:triosephosphate isomerase
MRKPVIAGNWKMYKTLSEAEGLVNELVPLLKDISDIDIAVCPPFTNLTALSALLKETNIGLGGQDVHWEEQGAFTGEISGNMLKSVGCSYVIIGHSERRQYFDESDEDVNKKLIAALKTGLKPIVCVGETLGEREDNQTFKVIENQLRDSFYKIDNSMGILSDIIVAYEPVWAIGTGKNATPEQANEVHVFIRKIMAELFGVDFAENLRIQYGGSVKPDNVSGLMAQTDIDGALVGGASLKADAFSAICHYQR